MEKTLKERLHELEEREARLAEAESITQIGSWIWRIAKNEVFWSDEMFRILGLDKQSDRPTSELFFNAVHPDDRDKVQKESANMVETGKPRPLNIRIIRPSGEIRMIRMTSAQVKGDGPLPLKIVGTLVDQTESLKKEAELKFALDQFNEAQKAAHIGSWVWFVEREIGEWSDELYRICGKTPQNFVPSLKGLFELIHEDDREKLNASVELSMQGKESSDEYRIRRDDGVIRHVRIESCSARAENGTPTIVRGTMLDITKHKELELQQRQSQKMEALGNLSGGVAHDLNNYMQVIGANVEHLCEELPPGDADLNQSKEDIFSSLSLCASLTTGLLAFSRQQEVRRKPIVLHDVIVSSLKLVEKLLGVGVRIELALDAENSVVSCDRNQIEQLVFNLAINARDAMRGKGTLKVSTCLIQDNEGHVKQSDVIQRFQLSIRDSGHGMSEEVAAKIFEPFFTTKPAGHGTGLGLSTVYGIVQQCGGCVVVQSTEGDGANFIFDFPLATQPVSHDSTPPPTHAAPHNEALTILVVEDEPMVRRAISKTLTNSGYHALQAGDGSEALAILASPEGSQVRLILTDLVMPNLNGAELVAALRKLRSNTPILLMTGHADGRQICLDTIKDLPLVRKPFTPKQLQEALYLLLDQAPQISKK